MKEKHNKVPWYSSEVRGPSAPATASEPVPVPPVTSVVVLEESKPLEETLPYVEAPPADDDDALLDEEPVESTPTQPPTPSTETIEHQLERLPSDTRVHDYPVHSTHHPAAPDIVSRYHRFDTPDEAQQVTPAIVASTTPDCPNPDPPEGPSQRKRRKVEFSVQTELTRSFKWKPHSEDDPDVPPSTA